MLNNSLKIINESIHMYSIDSMNRFQSCNQKQLEDIGAKDYSDVINVHIKEFFPADHVSVLADNNKRIIRYQQPDTFIEPLRSPSGETHHYLSYKYPVFSEERRCIGITGISMLLSPSQQGLATLNNLVLMSLSKREHQCCLLMTEGLSAKEISKKIDLNWRTVEAYLLSARRKLNCRNNKELITKFLLSSIQPNLFITNND